MDADDSKKVGAKVALKVEAAMAAGGADIAMDYAAFQQQRRQTKTGKPEPGDGAAASEYAMFKEFRQAAKKGKK